MFVVDTNVLSELRAGKPKPSASVRAWAASVPASQLFLSAVTIWELEMGVLALERSTPPQGRTLRTWLAGIEASFAGRILPFTGKTAPICAALNVPNRRPARDSMIAATALEHRMTVVTRNMADFAGTGVPLIDPF
jgi:predicted nucleic acid-binding protein